MTTTGLRITIVAVAAAIGVIAASAPLLAAPANSGSASKQQGGGRTLADYNIQKE